MSPLTGPFHALLIVLLLSGLDKLRRPGGAAAALVAARLVAGGSRSRFTARLLGAAEISLAAWAAAAPSPASIGAVALLFAGFVWFGSRLSSTDASAGCGCFGSDSVPPGPVHRRFNLTAVWVLVVVGVLVASGRSVGLSGLVSAGPGVWVPYLGAAAVGSGLFLLGPSLLAALAAPEPEGDPVAIFSVSGPVSR